MLNAIPGKLRRDRILLGLSAAYVAKRVGIARSTLTHYETNIIKRQDPAVLARLAAFYEKKRASLAGR